MPNKVLIYSRFPKALMLRIGERFELMDAAGKRPNEIFSAEQLSDVRAMITAGGTPLAGDMMDLMPKLAAIVCYGTGYDGVDLAAATKRGIALGHSPGANAASVADIAVPLMLPVTRQPQPPRRALSISAEPRGAGGMVQRAHDLGSRRRRHASCRQCRHPAQARQG